MIFADYTFDVIQNGTIIFDEEIKPSDLYLSEGDEYVVEIRNDRVVFKKTSRNEP